MLAQLKTLIKFYICLMVYLKKDGKAFWLKKPKQSSDHLGWFFCINVKSKINWFDELVGYDAWREFSALRLSN